MHSTADHVAYDLKTIALPQMEEFKTISDKHFFECGTFSITFFGQTHCVSKHPGERLNRVNTMVVN